MSRRARPLDRVLALLGILGTSPLWLLAAVGIRVSDPGPVIYRARRAGVDGAPFTMFKFRTMRVAGAASVGGRISSGQDPRVFAWGRLLRRLKIDELPQLVNVAKGDMAIVGPRPEDPTIVQTDYAPWMMETLSVLPGLTSPGSLAYYADEVSIPDDPAEAEQHYLADLLPRKLAIDLVYVRERSLRYDVMLVLRTLGSIAGRHHLFPRQQAHERPRPSASCKRCHE